METTKQKSVAEINAQIQAVTSNQRRAAQKIDGLRTERAQLSVNGDGKNSKRISCIDTEVAKLTADIGNYPAELKLLEDNLATEQQRLVQTERDDVLEKQNDVARHIESLSTKLVKHLKIANDTNITLRDALSAYNGLKEKTHQDVLDAYVYVDGSMDSLRMLLELMTLQLSGQHTFPAGAGMTGSNTPIRL